MDSLSLCGPLTIEILHNTQLTMTHEIGLWEKGVGEMDSGVVSVQQPPSDEFFFFFGL